VELMLDTSRSRKCARTEPRFVLSYAGSLAELREAQRLRYAVFAEEMGARLTGPEAGVDEDRFDAFCDHLLVRDADTGEVVGTYRLLAPDAARAAGGCYSAQEFDLARLAQLAPRVLEVGRSCIHPDYRNGAVISLLWSGLAAYMERRRLEYLCGCASISMADGGRLARAVYAAVAERHFAPAEYRVFPRCRLPLDELASAAPVEIPPLVKGYLRVGAYVCGEPAWDPDFNTADLFVLLPVARADARYLRHYSRPSGAHRAAG
jgi:putative hemolysin